MIGKQRTHKSEQLVRKNSLLIKMLAVLSDVSRQYFKRVAGPFLVKL